MKFSISLNRLVTVILAAVLITLSSAVRGGAPQSGSKEPIAAGQTFASPEEAIKALQTAVESKNPVALEQIFGSEFRELETGDKVQDANNRQAFATVMAQGCRVVKEGEDQVALEIGTNNWPLPIPLVQTNGQWRFDTVAGKEEIINRLVGRDELHAIGVCRAYVSAQRKYASLNLGAEGRAIFSPGDSGVQQARRMVSIGLPRKMNLPVHSDLS
jgi:hypothetical protein